MVDERPTTNTPEMKDQQRKHYDMLQFIDSRINMHDMKVSWPNRMTTTEIFYLDSVP